jgi:hypothetical protein
VPFKSKAQRRKFAELLVKGEISPETFEEWSRETGSAKLPERAPRKRAGKKRGARKKSGIGGRKRRTAAAKRRPARHKRASKGMSRGIGNRKGPSSVRKRARKQRR